MFLSSCCPTEGGWWHLLLTHEGTNTSTGPWPEVTLPVSARYAPSMSCHSFIQSRIHSTIMDRSLEITTGLCRKQNRIMGSSELWGRGHAALDGDSSQRRPQHHLRPHGQKPPASQRPQGGIPGGQRREQLSLQKQGVTARARLGTGRPRLPSQTECGGYGWRSRPTEQVFPTRLHVQIT